MAQNADCKTCLLHLQGYADNELDAAASAAVLSHLGACEKCRAALKEQQALSGALRRNLPRHAAPAGLADKIRQTIREEAARKPRTGRGPGWQNLLLPGFSAAALALSVLLFFAQPAPDDLLADEVIAGHVRSLMAQHMTDVASSDQHTVKPWFAGRLDFSLPVRDFAGQGFPLAGGRLDYLQHGTAAALVYRHDKHVINVFVTPSAAGDLSPHRLSRRGYNLVFWRRNGLSFEAVSDLNADDLSALCALIAG